MLSRPEQPEPVSAAGGQFPGQDRFPEAKQRTTLGQPIRFVVTEEDSSLPIPQVSVTGFCASSGGLLLGRTDADGQLRTFLPPSEERRWLRATVEGYAVRWLACPEPVPAVMEIRLRPEGVLRGKLVDGSGKQFPLVAQVVAWPMDSSLTEEQVSSLLRWGTAPGLHAEPTAPDGTFEIHGLDPDLLYRIDAGGRGLAQLRDLPPCQPDTGEVQLPVGQLHAAWARIRDGAGDGLPACSIDLVAEGQGLAWETRPSGFAPFHRRLAALLAGVPPGSFETGVAAADQFFLVAGKPGQVEAPSLHLELGIAGYRPVDALFPLAALPKEIPIHSILLENRSAVRGTCEVEIVLPWSPDQVPASALIRAGVVFESVDGATYSTGLKIGNDGGIHRIEGLPAGDYRVRFRDHRGWYREHAPAWPIGPVAIGAKDASVTFSFEDGGGFHLDPLTKDGVAYRGPLSLLLHRLDDESRHSANLVFTGPPYLAILLPEGRYRVEVVHPFRAKTIFAGEESLMVLAGFVPEIQTELLRY